ncbi:MAG: protein kinase [Myxococcota bacterium]
MALTPEHIGPYRIIRPIASGGMAEVYEVQDPASGERLALKLLVAVRQALKRFDREYEAMTRLNHPGIVRVYHYGLHQGHPWLTMELLRGVAAQSHIKRTGRPGSPRRLREVLRLGYHVSKALHYIHERNLVHRDLKSANVIVLPDDRVKLLDFGAAHLVDSHRITQEGEFVGTFAYASPEQILAGRIDHRSDLYSLGVLLFRLATGRRPFSSRDHEQLIRQHLYEPPPDPREFVPTLPNELSDLVTRLLAKSPEDRVQTADRVATTLERLHSRPFTTRSRLAIHEAQSAPRGPERHRLWEHLEEGPESSLVVVTGEDGSDRSRLLETIDRESKERGVASYLVQLRRGEAMARLCETLIAMAQDCFHPDKEALSETVEKCCTPAALANPTGRATLRQAAVDIARLRASNQPVVMLVQEVHRADPLTLDLLGGLRRGLQQVQDTPFKVVASCRSSELEPGSAVYRRLNDPMVIALSPLDPRQIAVSVGHMLGRRPPTAELARQLHEVTAGQPLYVEETVQLLVASGGIEAEDSRLAWADQTTEVPRPERATAAAERVLRTLPLTWRRVLEALAVADDATQLSVLARLIGWSQAELNVAVDGLCARGVVRRSISEPTALLWRHPLLPKLLRDRVNPARRALYLSRLATAESEDPHSKGRVAALVATGRVQEAAVQANSLTSELLTQHRIRSVLEMAEPVVDRLRVVDRAPECAELLLQYARCLRTVAPTDPSNGRTLQQARQLAQLLDDSLLVVRTDLEQAKLYKTIGHYGVYRKYLEQAFEGLREPNDEPAIAAHIAMEYATSYRLQGHVAKADEWAAMAVDHAETSGDVALMGRAIVESASCLLASGQVVEAEAAFSLAMEHFERAHDACGLWRAVARWSHTLRLQARYSEALAQLYKRLPAASQCQDSVPYVELLQATGWVELDLSRLGRAQECTDELAATLHKGAHLYLRLKTNLLTGRILLASGEPQTAAYVLQEVHRSARNAQLAVLAEHARAVQAEALHAIGDAEGASSAFQSAILGLLGAGDVTILAEAVRGRARTAATREDPSEIFRHVRTLLDEQPMVLLQLEHLLAKGAWHRARQDPAASDQAFREAAMVLNRMATNLSDTDRAALRVHPWSSWIRQGRR